MNTNSQADSHIAQVLLICGNMCSGKTTLASALSQEFRIPLLSKDTFKETLFDSLGTSDRTWSRKVGAASMELLWQLTESLLSSGVSFALEANFNPQTHSPLLSKIFEAHPCQVFQICCTAPTAALIQRFHQRNTSGTRHLGHGDSENAAEFLPLLQENDSKSLKVPSRLLEINTADDGFTPGLVSKKLRSWGFQGETLSSETKHLRNPLSFLVN